MVNIKRDRIVPALVSNLILADLFNQLGDELADELVQEENRLGRSLSVEEKVRLARLVVATQPS